MTIFHNGTRPRSGRRARSGPRLRRAPALLGALLLTAAVAHAQGGASPALPVRDVTMYSSGVAFIERAGKVDGNAAVPLTFRTQQINDILKSLVLIDEKGKVQPVTYTAKDPIARTLQSFAIDVTQPMSRAELLNRMRGARVTVETNTKEKIEGQIVGVETRTETSDDKEVTVEILSLLDDGALRSVRLDEVRSIRFVDERLQREFREALTLLATASDDQRRQVTLNFAGSGSRTVRVGYIAEAPLWKISYRLLLGGTDTAATAAKPYLQGWALVENTTDEDWNGVHLSLVSGRPVSFIQDLYQPLYLPRPVVPVDVVASPYPQAHGSDLRENAAPAEEAESMSVGGFGGGARRAPGLAGPAGPVGMADGAPAPSAMPASPPMPTRPAPKQRALQMQESVTAQAAGEDAGELFQYDITTPVTLPRQQAAMIPVVAQDIAAEKLLLFNADAQGKYPLNAVRVKNTTKLHLKSGAVTIFDEGVYAGDARMEDVPPGEDRLVSYAVDLSVEGERQNTGYNMVETSLSLKRGVLTVTRRERTETTYTLKSKADEAKTVLVEHPFQAEYKLVQPAEATERSRDYWRFAVPVPARETKKLVVVLERPVAQAIGVFDADLNALGVYASRKEISPRLRETLQEIIRRRRAVQELQAQAQAREAEIAAIGQDQERVRKNMAALDKTSALYKRYVTGLDQQETRLQALRAEANRLRSEAGDANIALRAYIDNINIDEAIP